MKEEILKWFDDYVERANRKERRYLIRQRRRNLVMLEALQKFIQKQGKITKDDRDFRLEIIENATKYVEKRSWLPDSYRDLIYDWGYKVNRVDANTVEISFVEES